MNNFLIHYVWFGLMLFCVAFITSYAVYPLVLRMSRVWGIFDNPNARKLQRKPVPVLGGLSVFVGIVIGACLILTIKFSYKELFLIVAMAMLMLVGIMDDKKGLPVWFRFAMEILVVTGLVVLNGNYIDTLRGLWGVEMLPTWVAYTISIIAGVGIINAVNLIDGVDGYSSTYTIMATLMFGKVFYAAHIPGLAMMCMVVAGAMLPFLLHNVFGQTTKMFIGDGGALMVGVLMTSFVFSVVRHDSYCGALEQSGMGLIAMVLAILSVPIFDTLRVMTARMLRGQSPFKADKTHFHHLCIDLGFTHIGTTLMIILINVIIVLSWYVSWRIGLNAEMQLYVVMVAGLLLIVGVYEFMRWQQRRNTNLYKGICRFNKNTRLDETPQWRWMTKLVDGNLFAGGRDEDNIW